MTKMGEYAKKDSEILQLLSYFELNPEKFWYLLLFIYDYSWDVCMNGMKKHDSPLERLKIFVAAIMNNVVPGNEEKCISPRFKLPTSVTVKIGRDKMVIDDFATIREIVLALTTAIKGYTKEDIDSLSQPTFSHYDSPREQTSTSKLAVYFSRMFFSFFDLQPQIVEKRQKGAKNSNKEIELISQLIYLTEISQNTSYLCSSNPLYSLLRQYEDYINEDVGRKYVSF